MLTTVITNYNTSCSHNSYSLHQSLRLPLSYIYHFRMSNTNTNSAALEERLREELQTKLISARNTSKIPTAKDLLDAIIHHADNCYLISDDFKTAFTEYEQLQLTAHSTSSTTGGAQKYFLEMTILSSKHRNWFLRRYNDATSFNNAHDIYEILVAGGILEELDRTSAIAELANRNPEDTSTGVVNAHYERIEVNEMFRLNQMMFKELLENEEDKVEELRKKLYKKQQAEEEESKEMKKLLHEVRDATEALLTRRDEMQELSVKEDIGEMRKSMEEMKKKLRIQELLHTTREERLDELQESIKEISSKMDPNHALIERVAKTVQGVQREMKTLHTNRTTIMNTVATQCERAETKDAATQPDISKHTTATQTSAADWYEIPDEEIGSVILEDEVYQDEPLERRETREDPDTRKRRLNTDTRDTLRERLRFLRNAIAQDEELLRMRKTTPRKFNRKISKPQDATMECVFCEKIGDHYSDACPTIRRTKDRK